MRNERRNERTTEKRRMRQREDHSHAYTRFAILSIHLVKKKIKKNTGNTNDRFSQCSHLGSLLYRHEVGSALVLPD